MLNEPSDVLLLDGSIDGCCFTNCEIQFLVSPIIGSIRSDAVRASLNLIWRCGYVMLYHKAEIKATIPPN